MKKRTLTVRLIDALKPAPGGTKYDVGDAAVPGFAVRVTDTGAKSYVLIKRIPGASNPTRRTIAKVGAVELQQARAIARQWLEQIAAGIDPKAAAAASARETARVAENTFDAVAEAYIAARLGKQRKGEEIARGIRREFGGRVDGQPVGPWAGKPITDIEPSDVAGVITRKAGTEPAQALNLLSQVGQVFNWAVATGKIKFSPSAPVKPSILLDARVPRTRTLTDTELRRVWDAAETLGYPIGPIYRLLILTGLRLNEVADATWSEFNFEKGLWTIGAERMKNKLDHVIPTGPMVMEILTKLPRWKGGDFLFSNNGGLKSVWMNSIVKDRIDLRARVYSWCNHDLRRTMRTHLSEIPTIPEHVREAMIAHKRRGIVGVYDRSEYVNEKRAGFGAWEARLRGIVEPPPPNVVHLRPAADAAA